MRMFDTRAISSALDKGADPHTTGINFSTSLHIAARKNDVRLAKRLIDLKVDVSACNFYGHTSMWDAAEHGHETVVRLLLENGAAMNDINAALQIACDYRHLRVAVLLIQKGADVKYRRSLDENPLRCACETSPLEFLCGHENKKVDISGIMEFILDQGMDVNTRIARFDNLSLLAQVLLYRQYDTARLLISRGANVSWINEMGKNHLCSLLYDMTNWNPGPDMITMLLDHGFVADPKAASLCAPYETFRRNYAARKQIAHLCLFRDAGAPLLEPDFLPRDMFGLICRERLDLKEE